MQCITCVIIGEFMVGHDGYPPVISGSKYLESDSVTCIDYSFLAWCISRTSDTDLEREQEKAFGFQSAIFSNHTSDEGLNMIFGEDNLADMKNAA